MKTTVFRIDKMDCPTEERLIRNRLDGMEGVDHLDFNLMSRTLTVSYSGVEETAIAAAISTLGMEAVPQAVGPYAVQLPLVQRSFWRKPGTILTVVAGVCAIAAELLAVTAYSDDAIVVRLLAAIAIVTGGYETAGKAFVALRTFTLNIHFLMTLAVIGAVALGAWTEGGMVIFLFAVAELVEAQSLNRARGAIRMLMALAPDTALVLRDSTPQTMPVGEIAIGELVRIKPGERLPLDGIVRTGHSAVNQAPITGESMPVDKEPGDRVFAGSINGTGTIDYEVTHLASDSTIGRIAHLVEKATANRGRTERFVDQFARYYTPAIFGLAVVVAVLPPLLGGGWSNWVYNALVLLVIGCPCALVISTPVTIVSALSASARRGILVKGGEFMELGRELRGIAFDKTGTLTQAKPHVTDVISLDGLAAGELLHLAAAVEGKSEHPIASAIIAEHELHHEAEGEIAVSDFNAIHGRGASAVVGGETIFVGNHRLAHDLDVCSPVLEERLYELESHGKSTVVVMSGRKALGVIGVADLLRPTSKEAIERLHALGIRTAILSGDNSTTSASIASSLGIDDVRADLLPEEKIDALVDLERAHGVMGMVGEGVNDVPALAHATIGFAMGAASADVALETAGVALMDDDLRKLPEFIELSRRAIRILKENIAIALGLKAIFFVLALAGEATLWMAVFADMGASLIVVANGLRMLRNGKE